MENLLCNLEGLASILDWKIWDSSDEGLLTIEAMLKVTIRPFAYSNYYPSK